MCDKQSDTERGENTAPIESTASSQANNAMVEPRGEAIARKVSQFSLRFLGVAVIFGIGVHFANQKYWPYKPITRAKSVLLEAWDVGGFAPENAVGKAPENASRETWTAHHPDALLAGYRAVLGYEPKSGEFGMWIFDSSGAKVHERLLNYDVQDPDGPSGGSEAPHAFHVMKDGSVIVNSDKGDVMTRYDTCGEPMWSRKGSFHHSFAADPRGGLWTWHGEVTAFDQYQFLTRFDPETGETIEEISLIDDIIDTSSENRTIFTIVPGKGFEHYKGRHVVYDRFHPNDLEVLRPEMADAFPQFEAGDLLLSFRNINMVAVLAPDTRQIKWWSHGPWIQQHDPDFTANGEISVYNNNGYRGESSIIAMDPQTRQVRTVEIDPDFRFYSQYMGKHEYLQDGTLQITVPYEGRAMEFDKNGRLLLEINNIFNEGHNAFISDYLWLPEDYFDIAPADFACNNGQPS
ncbi:arylsulfotransferase family protein [Granulosicoccus antarcticus]|uniref:Arylsulfotransferase (ASST) n=1 Tax=Granulosicoccus antarcticus IMCC3135 TaxID=1192854 RepID=A0A2Z2NJN5_9GAMM|nr:arylsulfotransferase family protein [Granulosicoccus antarcticus]ASJ70715.1 hypothetical protein IMCC3135_03010 [Granulosicoccus antarcticus IMCC3135]